MHAFEQLDINLEVEWNLSLLLLSLELHSLVLLLGNLLGQQFADFAVLADVGQDLVGLLDLAQAEGAQADLDQGAVVQNLIFDGLGLDQRAQVRLHQRVTGLAQMVVDCKVVNEHQCGTHALSWAAPLVNLLDKVAHQLLGVILEHKH